MYAYSRFFNFGLFSLLFWFSLVLKRDDGFSWNVYCVFGPFLFGFVFAVVMCLFAFHLLRHKLLVH